MEGARAMGQVKLFKAVWAKAAPMAHVLIAAAVTLGLVCATIGLTYLATGAPRAPTFLIPVMFAFVFGFQFMAIAALGAKAEPGIMGAIRFLSWPVIGVWNALVIAYALPLFLRFAHIANAAPESSPIVGGENDLFVGFLGVFFFFHALVFWRAGKA
jgi:hypothetical protein